MDSQDWIKTVIRGVMCLSGIVGNNWLCFRSLPSSRSQLRTGDLLFINLALSNLITNYFVDLPDTLNFIESFSAGRRYCGAFNFCSDLSETSSIFTTLFITVFWHQKLVGSLKRGGAPVQMDSLRLVLSLLAGSWTVAVVFSIPHFFFMSELSGNKSTTECMEDFHSQDAKQAYELLYLLLANLSPILGIFFASIQITVTLLKIQKRVKANTPGLSSSKTSSSPADPLESVSQSSSVIQNHKHNSVIHKPKPSSAGTLLRAAKSVVAVATVFVFCWLTHLVLSIISTVRESVVVVEFASYIGAVYTCIIPFIYLHGVKKLTCSC